MPAIKVENLGKSYLVGHNAAQSERYTALRDVIARNAKSLARKTRDMLHGRAIIQGDEVEEFWALRDINFEIRQGDRVGVIGRNGAGKSTLLKILSRITEPTTGRVTINGRVASLLEVGTGFHPELTGRENIFLNGAILGMNRKEIQKKFDEIVDFAEVEKFLDTPVKRYSSGMYVRLAFAVAAHLEPEILVVDEVLAVGDTQFQKKCLGKMEKVGSEGRTVLFVSHNLSAIERLCDICLLIDKGQLIESGCSQNVIATYHSAAQLNDKLIKIGDIPRRGDGSVRLEGVYVTDKKDMGINVVSSGENVTFTFDYAARKSALGKEVSFGFSLHNNERDSLSILYNDYVAYSIKARERGRIRFSIVRFPFTPGTYYIRVRILVNGIEADWPFDDVGQFIVAGGDYYGHGIIENAGLGCFFMDGVWCEDAL